MTVESCEAAVLRELERRGVVYEAGNHNKYISDTMGIERIRSGNARGYRLVEISPEQISINQRALGSFTDEVIIDEDDENQ